METGTATVPPVATDHISPLASLPEAYRPAATATTIQMGPPVTPTTGQPAAIPTNVADLIIVDLPIVLTMENGLTTVDLLMKGTQMGIQTGTGLPNRSTDHQTIIPTLARTEAPVNSWEGLQSPMRKIDGDLVSYWARAARQTLRMDVDAPPNQERRPSEVGRQSPVIRADDRQADSRLT